MANKNLGTCECPICEKSAYVRETKKDKAYILCDDCGFQGFARGFTANKLLRGKMRVSVESDAGGLPMVTVHPAPKSAPAVAMPAAEVTEKQPAPVERELTIFDKEFYK